MKSILVAAVLSVFAAGALPAFAGDKAAKGEKAEKADKAAASKSAGVTLKGTMMCAKCALKETDKCQNVLKVTEGGKETAYYLVHNDVAKKNHGPVCSGTANATVKGSVAEEGGKKTLTASEIKYE
jgi:hypothetical protein